VGTEEGGGDQQRNMEWRLTREKKKRNYGKEKNYSDLHKGIFS
jgi:hypothetical protein